eukprot:NODE_238_length_13323_cov_0.463854.p7 type:complete len:146 gc:universal NODE_238_length_13323_cov_0.463854:1865-1428(-)
MLKASEGTFELRWNSSNSKLLLIKNFVGEAENDQALTMFASTLKHIFVYVKCYGDKNHRNSQNIFCFASQDKIVFRKASEKDALENPIRMRVFQGLLSKELELNFMDTIISMKNVEYFEYLNKSKYLYTWTAMQDLLPPELWILY